MKGFGLVEPVPVLRLLEGGWVEVSEGKPALLVEELGIVLKARSTLGSGSVRNSHFGVKEQVSSAGAVHSIRFRLQSGLHEGFSECRAPVVVLDAGMRLAHRGFSVLVSRCLQRLILLQSLEVEVLSRSLEVQRLSKEGLLLVEFFRGETASADLGEAFSQLALGVLAWDVALILGNGVGLLIDWAFDSHVVVGGPVHVGSAPA